MATLDEICNKYGHGNAMNPKTGRKHEGGDKGNKYHNYLMKYEQLFKTLKDDKISLLEIGVLEGRSIALWADYFVNGTIVGVDTSLKAFNDHKPELLNQGAFAKNNNYHLIEGNSLDPEIKNKINSYGQFDIIIDDGDHLGTSQAKTFENLFYQYLKPGGIYIIEDCHVGFISTYFAKQMDKCYKLILQKINAKTSNNEYYKNVKSVEFYRRLIIIHKK